VGFESKRAQRFVDPKGSNGWLIVSVDLIIFKAKVIEFHTTKIHNRTWSRDHGNQLGGTNYCLNTHQPLIQVELHHVNPWLVSTSTCHLFCPWSPTLENIHYRFRSTFLMDYWFNSERELDVSPTLSLSLKWLGITTTGTSVLGS